MDTAAIASRLRRYARQLTAQAEVRDSAIDFLLSHPEPSDAEFHEWAESRGFDKHEAEETAYKLAAFMARFLRGGRANTAGVGPKDVDPDELAAGVETEAEHAPDVETRERIALDHMAESPDSPLGYYEGLALLEKLREKLSKIDPDEASDVIADFRALVEDIEAEEGDDD